MKDGTMDIPALGKTDPTFYLANSLSEQELVDAKELGAGYNPVQEKWELIVKYQGNIRQYESEMIRFEELIAGYAIATIERSAWEYLENIPEIEYIEKPRPIYPQTVLGQESSCILPVKRNPYGLSGNGVLVAVIDSSVDYRNVHFRKPDGTTRILALWDQNDVVPANGISDNVQQANLIDNGREDNVAIGREYSGEEINAALSGGEDIPVMDVSGHGTAVTGILAGSRTDDFEGVAPECDLLIVKLRRSGGNVFTQSADIMRAVSYALRKAREVGMPLVINLSYGTVWGSHKGDSLLERFMNNASEIGVTSIVTGSGNEGDKGVHYRKKNAPDEPERAELEVGLYDFGFSLHIFYPGQEIYRFAVVTSRGEQIELPEEEGLFEGTYEGIKMDAVYSNSKPYSTYAELFVRFLPTAEYMPSGGWYLLITPVKTLTGDVNIYLSGSVSGNAATRFIEPSTELTLTIPSTAERVITVGAYSAFTNGFASFSGRGVAGGEIGVLGLIKPDLLAPGVNIRTVRVGGGYTTVTGTSFATPFVSGSAALLMEWGIVRGNDPYLYGERMKSVLLSGAIPFAGADKLPNERDGWGALCLAQSLTRVSV